MFPVFLILFRVSLREVVNQLVAVARYVHENPPRRSEVYKDVLFDMDLLRQSPFLLIFQFHRTGKIRVVRDE